MSQSKNDSVVDFVTRFVSLITDEVKIASMLYHAVFAFSKIEPLLQAARQQLRQHHKSDAGVVRLMDASRTLGQWARELVDDDYHALTIHSLIGLWATVEVTVEDTVTFILTSHPERLEDVGKAGVGLPGTLSKPLNETDARRLYRRLESHCREDRNVAAGYCYLLSLLGIHVALTPDTTTTLAELNYVRNCFLHRGGIVDERAAQEAPSLAGLLGTKIRISEGKSKEYLKAVGDFAQALLKSAFESR